MVRRAGLRAEQMQAVNKALMRPPRSKRLQTRLMACRWKIYRLPCRNVRASPQSGFSRPSSRAISASSESMSAKGSSTFGVGLLFGAALALSAGGRVGAMYFGAPSDGAEGEAFGAGRAPEAASAGGMSCAVGAATGSAFAAAPEGSALGAGRTSSAFAAAALCSGFSGRAGGAGPTRGGAGGGPLFAGALSVR